MLLDKLKKVASNLQAAPMTDQHATHMIALLREIRDRLNDEKEYRLDSLARQADAHRWTYGGISPLEHKKKKDLNSK